MRFFLFIVAVIALITGCGISDDLGYLVDPKTAAKDKALENPSDFYDKYFVEVTNRVSKSKGTRDIMALNALPQDPYGGVNWTAAVVKGIINPRPSLEPDVVDDPPLKLNIFIEAKVPLMNNVIFPHSIHTYWLDCKNCHPKIFLPEAGANPISMDEIFKGQWCGRCHGKVAFGFWPRENCLRCHIIYKGESLQKEHWR